MVSYIGRWTEKVQELFQTSQPPIPASSTKMTAATTLDLMGVAATTSLAADVSASSALPTSSDENMDMSTATRKRVHENVAPECPRKQVQTGTTPTLTSNGLGASHWLLLSTNRGRVHLRL